jgi:hypothetical protein
MDLTKVDTIRQSIDNKVNVYELTRGEAIALNFKLQNTQFRLWTDADLMEYAEGSQKSDEEHDSANMKNQHHNIEGMLL